MNTHFLELSDVVVKRFRSYDRGEHRREWTGLRLLARHAPGLAPRPLAADLDADPPTVTTRRRTGGAPARRTVGVILRTGRRRREGLGSCQP